MIQGFDRKGMARYSSRLMSWELDRTLDVAALAARGFRLRSETSLESWPRLAEINAGGPTQALVRVDVTTRTDEGGVPVLEGELAAELRGTCQRCLEEMDIQLRTRPRLYFGAAEQMGAVAVEAGFEACEPESGMTLRTLLEDELLLSAPAIPVHARSEECGPLAGRLADLEPAERGQRPDGPFAVLAGLKKRTD